MKFVRASSVACAALLSLAGCSLLVQPDDNRLREGGASDGSTLPDGNPPDARRPDGSTGEDVIVPEDVVTPMDVPDASTGEDVVTPPIDVMVPDASACVGGCNDGVSCTDDRCNEALGRCEFTANSALCPMGQICNATMGCMTMGCTSNTQCDDGNVCNGAEQCSMGRCVGGTALNCNDGDLCNGTETCDARMGCRPGTALNCDDGRFCNGAETCDRARGCLPGTAPTCRDGNVCTNDACDSTAMGGRGACVNALIDADMDGAPAASVGGVLCAGGTDCNDGDRAINPGAMEVCNSRDDNCNMMVDEGLTCSGPPANDQCSASQGILLTLVTPTVTVTGTTAMATSQVTSRCGGDGQPDVFYTITLPTDRDVRIEVTPAAGSMTDPILQYVGTGCGTNIVACNDDQTAGTRASRMWLRALPFSTGLTRQVVVAVDSFNAAASGAFTLTATLTAPNTASACGGGRFDVSQGGTVYHVVQPQMGSISGSCAPMGAGYTALGEQGYVYTGAARGVNIVGFATGFRPMLTVRSATNCGTENGCAYSGNNTTTLNTMQNTAAIVIDGIPNMGGGGTSYQYQLEVIPQ